MNVEEMTTDQVIKSLTVCGTPELDCYECPLNFCTVESSREMKIRAAELLKQMQATLDTYWQTFVSLSLHNDKQRDHICDLLKAENEKRLIILPAPINDDYPGLKVKYRVYKSRDNTPVENCFVLRPDKDPAALYALMCYGLATDNQQLGADVLKWVQEIEIRELDSTFEGLREESDDLR